MQQDLCHFRMTHVRTMSRECRAVVGAHRGEGTCNKQLSQMRWPGEYLGKASRTRVEQSRDLINEKNAK
jgi:hypothetical protein